MANSLVQVRVDEKLKEDVTTIYEELGMDLPTAIRIFLKPYHFHLFFPYAASRSQ